jgi:hypothetical protein
MPSMVVRNIQDYTNRDWESVRVFKDRYWRDRIERLGVAEAFRIAEELRRQVAGRDRSWPGDEARHEDLLAHARLAEVFQRADAARRD